jgi:hypothetical protein
MVVATTHTCALIVLHHKLTTQLDSWFAATAAVRKSALATLIKRQNTNSSSTAVSSSCCYHCCFASIKCIYICVLMVLSPSCVINVQCTKTLHRSYKSIRHSSGNKLHFNHLEYNNLCNIQHCVMTSHCYQCYHHRHFVDL